MINVLKSDKQYNKFDKAWVLNNKLYATNSYVILSHDLKLPNGVITLENLIKVRDKAYKFSEVLENTKLKYHQENTSGNILIHCFMGASRSASIVIYYLMQTQKKEDDTHYTFDDAVSFLKDKRIVVNPTFRLTKDLAQSVMIKKEQKNLCHY